MTSEMSTMRVIFLFFLLYLNLVRISFSLASLPSKVHHFKILLPTASFHFNPHELAESIRSSSHYLRLVKALLIPHDVYTPNVVQQNAY